MSDVCTEDLADLADRIANNHTNRDAHFPVANAFADPVTYSNPDSVTYSKPDPADPVTDPGGRPCSQHLRRRRHHVSCRRPCHHGDHRRHLAHSIVGALRRGVAKGQTARISVPDRSWQSTRDNGLPSNMANPVYGVANTRGWGAAEPTSRSDAPTPRGGGYLDIGHTANTARGDYVEVDGHGSEAANALNVADNGTTSDDDDNYYEAVDRDHAVASDDNGYDMVDRSARQQYFPASSSGGGAPSGSTNAFDFSPEAIARHSDAGVQSAIDEAAMLTGFNSPSAQRTGLYGLQDSAASSPASVYELPSPRAQTLAASDARLAQWEQDPLEKAAAVTALLDIDGGAGK